MGENSKFELVVLFVVVGFDFSVQSQSHTS